MKRAIPRLAHEQPPLEAPAATGLGRWVQNHDDSRLFAVLYIGLALVLSIVLGLFWLVAVVALHGLLEVLRQRSLHRWWPGVLSRVLWELKLDLGLILFAFVVTLYMEVVLGVAGLNAAVRAGARGGARLLAWQRGLRAAMLSVDDVAQVARIAAGRRRAAEQATGEAAEAAEAAAPAGSSLDGLAALGVSSPWGGWAERWSRGSLLAVAFGLLSLGLILAAPWLTGQPAGAVWQQILAELRPFPD